jgi:hypothetical protein
VAVERRSTRQFVLGTESLSHFQKPHDQHSAPPSSSSPIEVKPSDQLDDSAPFALNAPFFTGCFFSDTGATDTDEYLRCNTPISMSR